MLLSNIREGIISESLESPKQKMKTLSKSNRHCTKTTTGVNQILQGIDRFPRTGVFPILIEDKPSRHTTSLTSFPESSSTSEPTSYAQVTSEASASKEQRPRFRPIIVKLSTYQKRKDIMLHERKLKNTGKSIPGDLTVTNYI